MHLLRTGANNKRGRLANFASRGGRAVWARGGSGDQNSFPLRAGAALCPRKRTSDLRLGTIASGSCTGIRANEIHLESQDARLDFEAENIRSTTNRENAQRRTSSVGRCVSELMH